MIIALHLYTASIFHSSRLNVPLNMATELLTMHLLYVTRRSPSCGNGNAWKSAIRLPFWLWATFHPSVEAGRAYKYVLENKINRISSFERNFPNEVREIVQVGDW